VKKSKTTNPQLQELIRNLRKQSTQNKTNIWRDIAERLAKPRRKRPAVNVSRLERYTRRNEFVVVPGKVLGTGEIHHAITVAAFAFSGKAKEKIVAAKGKCLSFSDLVKKKPKDTNVKIIG
jgi:large subunit ribosomal protein L18e